MEMRLSSWLGLRLVGSRGSMRIGARLGAGAGDETCIGLESRVGLGVGVGTSLRPRINFGRDCRYAHRRTHKCRAARAAAAARRRLGGGAE